MSDAELVYEDLWSSCLWNVALSQDRQTKQSVESGSKKVFNFPTFCKEVFNRLYNDPLKLPAKAIKSEAQWAVNAHDSLSSMPEFLQLEINCKSDRLLSAIATASFTRSIAESLPQPESELVDLEKLRNQVRSLREVKKNLIEQGIEPPKTILQDIAKITELGKQSGQNAVDFAQTMNSSDVRSLLKQSLKTALHETSAAEQAMDSLAFGWGQGDIDTIPDSGNAITEKMLVAGQVAKSALLLRVLKEAGRLKLVANKNKRKMKSDDSLHKIKGVDVGNDLTRLLPCETALLALPELAPLFLQKYSERSLLQYSIQGKDVLGQGPIIICLDSSGSMKGGSEIWSKAVAITLCRIAVEQKRHCRILHFDTRVRRSDDFSPNNFSVAKLLDSMQCFYGGNTDWESPLNNAAQLIEQKSELRKADVIFITDGLADTDEEFRSQLKSRQKTLSFTIYGVGIQLGQPGREKLSEICDRVISINDLNKDDAIGEVFAI